VSNETLKNKLKEKNRENERLEKEKNEKNVGSNNKEGLVKKKNK